MPNVAMKFPEKVQANIIAYLDMQYNRFDLHNVRTRLEKIDRAVQMESEERREKVEDFFNDIEISLVGGPISTVKNFLVDTFITGPQIFEVVTKDTKKQDAARQMNAIIEENGKASDWASQLILFLGDLPKYNYGIISCDWQKESFNSLASTTSATKNAEVKVDSREGNVLQRWDPYNTFRDPNVPINKNHREGEYIGHIERLTMTQLVQRLKQLSMRTGDSTNVMNRQEAFSCGSVSSNRYYKPHVHTTVDTRQETSGWESFFGTNTQMKNKDAESLYNKYEYVTLYARIIPSMLGMKVPAADELQIWRFDIVGWDKLVYAEKQSNVHNWFPAICTQIDDQGLYDQVKTNAEKLIPYQNLSTHYLDSRIAGLTRGLSDRALYDSNRIDRRHMTDNPKAKIPVRPSLASKTLADAYYPIPYNDNLGGTFLNEIQFLKSESNQISGFNSFQQGMPQKGNRTLGEFNEVMANADDDLRTFAKLTNSQAITPLKYIIKMNILQYQPATTITTAEQESVKINPPDLRKHSLDFKMADGLISRESLLDTPTARAMMELILQVPSIQQYYGAQLPDLVEYIFSGIGFDPSKFRTNAGSVAPQEGQPAQSPAQQPAQPAQSPEGKTE